MALSSGNNAPQADPRKPNLQYPNQTNDPIGHATTISIAYTFLVLQEDKVTIINNHRACFCHQPIAFGRDG